MPIPKIQIKKICTRTCCPVSTIPRGIRRDQVLKQKTQREPVNHNGLDNRRLSHITWRGQLQHSSARSYVLDLHFVSFSPGLFPFQADDRERHGPDEGGLEDQCVVHVKWRMCIRSGSQSRLSCCELLVMVPATYITRKGHAQRIITIVKI